MKRSHPSGAQKRKRLKTIEREKEALSGSLLKFVRQIPKSESEEKFNLPDDRTLELEQIDAVEQHETFHVKSKDLNVSDLSLEKTKTPTPIQKSEDLTNDSIKNIKFLYCDVGNWQIPLSDSLRVEIIKRKSEHFQHKDGPFGAVKRVGENLKGQTRQLTKYWFYKHLPNGEKILRKWMVYSPSKKCLFCFCCRLFAVHDDQGADISKFITGFHNWWKLNPKVSHHENSETHLNNFEKWKTLKLRLELNETIDDAHQKNRDLETKKWNDILHRLLDITMFLAKQNISFRGHKEHEFSENKGNFLELVELISHYDPVLREHLVRKRTSGNTISYLSPKIQNELISLLGNTVKQKIIDDIKKSKYYGIMFDSTPDASHQDQLSQIIRYVYIENEKVEVRESFLGFYILSGKKAVDVTNTILNIIDEEGLDINLCRSQGYDNASTMAGVHSGVQARIKQINKKALFVPCTNHSLNLSGVHAFGNVSTCVTFFGTLESVYNFFSSSTHRWDILSETVGVTVKRLSGTRWSEHYNAVKPVMNNFQKLVIALEMLCDPSENVDTRGSAQMLIKNICDFNFLSYLHLWCNVLEEVNHTQKYLQTKGIGLDKTVHKLVTLKHFLEENRDELVENALTFSKNFCDKMGIPTEKSKRKSFKKMMPGEEARDEALTLKQELRRCMFQSIDNFRYDLNTRLESVQKIYTIFAAVQSSQLVETNIEELPELIKNFSEVYDEVEENEILPEIKRLRRHLQAAKVEIDEAKKWSALQMLSFVVKMDFQESVPNLYFALKIFLTVCISIASCERSFSKLKLIKNYLRSTMSQVRLNGLAMLSIENAVAKKVNFDETISKFSEAKARKKHL